MPWWSPRAYSVHRPAKAECLLHHNRKVPCTVWTARHSAFLKSVSPLSLRRRKWMCFLWYITFLLTVQNIASIVFRTAGSISIPSGFLLYYREMKRKRDKIKNRAGAGWRSESFVIVCSVVKKVGISEMIFSQNKIRIKSEIHFKSLNGYYTIQSCDLQALFWFFSFLFCSIKKSM